MATSGRGSGIVGYNVQVAVDAEHHTHVYPDHCNGPLTTEKQIAYPNAVVHINGDEYTWWMEGDVKVPTGKPFFAELFEGGRTAFKPYIDAKNVQTFKDGARACAWRSPAITVRGQAPGVTLPQTGGQNGLQGGSDIYAFSSADALS